jgi:glucose/mannose transport system permease protein
VLLLAPSAIAGAIFIHAFIAFTGYSSLSNFKTLVPEFALVGFRNNQGLFAYLRFQIDMRNTHPFMVYLWVAACRSASYWPYCSIQASVARLFFRGIYHFPMTISFSVASVAWRSMLNPGTAEGGATGVNLLLFEYVGLDFLSIGLVHGSYAHPCPPRVGARAVPAKRGVREFVQSHV